MITVCCVKAKPHYDHVWVNRLYRMVKENLTIPHRFICVTDDDSGVKCAVKRLPKGLGGWWSKLALHRQDFLEPPVFYLDLDVLILGNLDFIAEYKGDFALLRDFYRLDGFGSGVMLWNKPHPHIWENWLKNGTPNHPLGDQGWMEWMVPNADRLQDVFPDKFVSYKVHCEYGPPNEAAVMSFHGIPKNDDFPTGHWVSQIWEGRKAKAA